VHLAYRARLLVLWAGAFCLGGCGAPLPSPSVQSVMPDRLCGGQKATLQVAGDGFVARVVDTLGQPRGEAPATSLFPATTLTGAPLGGLPIALSTQWQSAQQLLADVPLGLLTSAIYDVTVTNPGGARATLSTSLTVLAGPTIDNVMPILLCSVGNSFTVTGNGFIPGARALVNDPSTNVSLDAITTTVVSATQITAQFGANSYADNTRLDFLVENPDGCAAMLADSVRRKSGGGGCP
jgi:hypothetical protein